MIDGLVGKALAARAEVAEAHPAVEEQGFFIADEKKYLLPAALDELIGARREFLDPVPALETHGIFFLK
jgi:F420-dependent methylenetetrahydromethanopterin dehydrogenase